MRKKNIKISFCHDFATPSLKICYVSRSFILKFEIFSKFHAGKHFLIEHYNFQNFNNFFVFTF